MKSNLQSRVEQQSRSRHQRVDGDLSRVQFQIGIQNLSANLGNGGESNLDFEKSTFIKPRLIITLDI